MGGPSSDRRLAELGAGLKPPPSSPDLKFGGGSAGRDGSKFLGTARRGAGARWQPPLARSSSPTGGANLAAALLL